MKQAAMKSTVDMLQKIETIEKEVMDLKVSVLKKLAPTGKNVISLIGILKLDLSLCALGYAGPPGRLYRSNR